MLSLVLAVEAVLLIRSTSSLTPSHSKTLHPILYEIITSIRVLRKEQNGAVVHDDVVHRRSRNGHRDDGDYDAEAEV